MSTPGHPRTAVVVVHGMGEQLPLETLNRFVRTALPVTDGERRYYSRPARVTGSFEARRMLAIRQPAKGGGVVHEQADFFEYHWSYLMTGNRITDVLPTLSRILLRRKRTVPAGLVGAWRLAWAVLVLLVLLVVAVFVLMMIFSGGVLDSLVTAVVGGGAVTTVLVALLRGLGDKLVTNTFVDVVRYLDRSPRSYAVRRTIRAGMVDLLRGLHAEGRYDRVVVVAHSLGAYIAYDGITSLWAECTEIHDAPLSEASESALELVEQSAAVVTAHPATDLSEKQTEELAELRERQLALWRAVRADGHPWLVTDFVSIGTPMYFADLLYTADRAEFDALVDRGELPQAPPLTNTRTVESTRLPPELPHYAYPVKGPDRRLTSGAPFAVVRWTNLYFPVDDGWHGDWFGGPLRPLFGHGVVDRRVTGNLPGRRGPGVAHGRYFDYPDATGDDDIATVLRDVLALTMDPR